MTETIRLSHKIGGCDVSGDVVLGQRNPASPEDLLVQLPQATPELALQSVEAARQAMTFLEAMGIEARADALARIGRALFAEAEPLALLIARETGKTIADARGEVRRAGRLFDFFAGETLRNVGERFASTRPGAMVELAYAPVGVVAAITPWNFPIAIPAWKIAPALAFGNAVVWKPSELSSATACALMAMITGSGLPEGSVNLLLGGGEAGRALVECEGIDAISFTGSAATGERVLRAAAAASIRVQLEMGGVNGLIVMADADLANAADCAVDGAFFSAGQRCTATSRIIVDNSIADQFVTLVKERAEALRIGDPRDETTQLGPLASPRQKDRVAAQVAEAEAGGLRPVVGGTRVMGNCFFAPTLFDHVEPKSLLAQEEIFGPVAGIFRVDGFEEAITRLNQGRFGLSAGICTRSLLHAEEFKRRARAGMLMVNLPTAGVDYHAPFGGMGASSYGPREQGRAARAFYTSMTTSYQKAL